MNGNYGFKKRHTDIIPGKNKQKIEYETPVWLDDIITVTRSGKNKHRENLFKILKHLLEAGYRASKKKSDFFSQKKPFDCDTR